jgi:hypothetical protein
MEDGTNYYHMNYGWGGSYDGWYAVDDLYGSENPMAEQMWLNIEPGADYEDGTASPLGNIKAGRGVAMGDYDGDGDVDIYLANDDPNKLFRNNGDGTFTDVTAPPVGNVLGGHGVAWADYDNDGDLDLYLANSLDANRLFRNDGGDVFTDATSGPLGDTGDGRGVAWGDYDNDGNVDLYVVNYGGQNKLLRNEGDGTFTDATTSPVDAGTTDGYAASWGDVDDDGDLDLYVVNDGGNYLFRNDGGVFVDVTAGPLGDGGDGRGVAWGDYDNDGDLDLYLANNGTGNALMRNDGSLTFADVTGGVALGDTGAGRGVGWADFDLDGDLDIYYANYGGENNLVKNKGGDEFQVVTTEPLGDSGAGVGLAWGDVDADGDLDIYHSRDGESNILFRNEYHQGNHWLQVKLVGTVSNGAGIGARVRVVSGGGAQIREISGGGGLYSQNSLHASFGLGEVDVVDSLQVSWPSGEYQETTLVSADTLITMVEPDDQSGAGEVAGTSTRVLLYANRPNPFTTATTLRYELPRAASVSLGIYDVEGRLVRELVSGQPQPAGPYSYRWDGRNQAGRAVVSGVYFYRLQTDRETLTRRMVVLR